jgi:hypothetical protein
VIAASPNEAFPGTPPAPDAATKQTAALLFR